MARLAKWIVGLGWARGLTVGGLLVTLFGAGWGATGVWVNEAGAIPIVPSQGSAAVVFGLIALGTVLQIAGVSMTPRLVARDVQLPAPPPGNEKTPQAIDIAM